MKRPIQFALLALGIIAFAVPLYSAQTVTLLLRISQTSSGTGANASSNNTTISPNGRYVAFDSGGSNLVSGDNNSSTDVFLRDVNAGTMQRVSVAIDGTEGDGSSRNPSLSPTAASGFFGIAFESSATNFELNPSTFPDTNNAVDVYFKLPTLNFMERISVGAGPTQGNNDSFDASATIVPEPNRLFVAYSSLASNLVSNDTNGFQDVYLATLTPPTDLTQFSFEQHLTTICITCRINGVVSNGDSGKAKISGNSRFVVFESTATNISNGTPPTTKQIYLYDSLNGSISLVSHTPTGEPGNGDSFAPSISYGGTYISYHTSATDILSDGVTVPANSVQVVYFNLQTGNSVRVNMNSSNQAGNGAVASNLSSAISPNGRFVAFSDTANNLVSSDQNGSADIFIRDFGSGLLIRATNDFNGTDPDGASTAPAFAGTSYNATSGMLGFDSNATDLISTDSEGRPDTFLGSLTSDLITLTRAMIVEVPPDSTLGTKRIALTAQKFAGANLGAARLGKGMAAASKRPRVQYRFQLFKIRDNQTRRSVQKLISKRNTLTFKNLKPGTYEATYRAEIVQKDRVKAKSTNSPVVRFKIS